MPPSPIDNVFALNGLGRKSFSHCPQTIKGASKAVRQSTNLSGDALVWESLFSEARSEMLASRKWSAQDVDRAAAFRRRPRFLKR